MKALFHYYFPNVVRWYIQLVCLKQSINLLSLDLIPWTSLKILFFIISVTDKIEALTYIEHPLGLFVFVTLHAYVQPGLFSHAILNRNFAFTDQTTLKGGGFWYKYLCALKCLTVVKSSGYSFVLFFVFLFKWLGKKSQSSLNMSCMYFDFFSEHRQTVVSCSLGSTLKGPR